VLLVAIILREVKEARGPKNDGRSPDGRVPANGVALPLMRKTRARVDGWWCKEHAEPGRIDVTPVSKWGRATEG